MCSRRVRLGRVVLNPEAVAEPQLPARGDREGSAREADAGGRKGLREGGAEWKRTASERDNPHNGRGRSERRRTATHGPGRKAAPAAAGPSEQRGVNVPVWLWC